MFRNINNYGVAKMKLAICPLWRALVFVCLLSNLMMSLVLLLQKNGNKSEYNELYVLVGKITFQEIYGEFPTDTTFIAETESEIKKFSVSDQVRFLTWACRRYSSSPSVTLTVVKLAERLHLRGLLDYHLSVLQDNTEDTQTKSLYKAIRTQLQ